MVIGRFNWRNVNGFYPISLRLVQKPGAILIRSVKRAFMAAELLRQYPIANGPRSPWTIASSDYSLAVEQRHLFFHITRAVNDILGADLIDSFEVLLHEKDISRGRIFLQVLDTLRTRDRQRPVGNRPGNGQLGWCTVLLHRDLLNLVDNLNVFPEVVSLEPRHPSAKIVGGQILESAKLAGDKAPAQWTVGHMGNPQLSYGREYLIFFEQICSVTL